MDALVVFESAGKGDEVTRSKKADKNSEALGKRVRIISDRLSPQQMRSCLTSRKSYSELVLLFPDFRDYLRGTWAVGVVVARVKPITHAAEKSVDALRNACIEKN